MNLPDNFTVQSIQFSETAFVKKVDDNNFKIVPDGLSSNLFSMKGSTYEREFLENAIKEGTLKIINQDELDIINKPSHYHKNEIDVNGYLEKHFPKEGEFTVSEGFYIGNALKYISRYKYKNGLEDLEKAAYYLGKLIDIEKGNLPL